MGAGKDGEVWVLTVLLSVWLLSGLAWAEGDCAGRKISHSTVYVPIYTQVRFDGTRQPFTLAAMISVRNLDMSSSIEIQKIEMRDALGAALPGILSKPVAVAPLGSYSISLAGAGIKDEQASGVLLTWKSSAPVIEPIVESVMIGAASGQGISFTSRGKPIGLN